MDGVYAVYENQFKIGTSGRASTDEQKLPIADMESFSVSIDNTLQEWTALENGGWVSGLITGKKLTIAINGKRNVGDAGNNYIAGLAFKTGRDLKTVLVWTFPDGTVVTIPVNVAVKNVGTGDSVNVGPLEFECTSDGKPTVTLPDAE